MAKRFGKVGFGTEKKDVETVMKGRYCGDDIPVYNNFDKVYKTSVDLGFDAVYAENRYNSLGKEEMIMHIKTPMTCNGEDVYGYAVVSTDRKDALENGLRGYNACEFYNGVPGSGAHNLEDLYPNGFELISNETGEPVSYMRALDTMGVFASAASEYPHVATYDEYMALKMVSNKKIGFPEPTEQDYNKYLELCERMLNKGNVTFVGDVRTVDGLDKRRMETPSFQNFMTDINSEREIPDVEAMYAEHVSNDLECKGLE